MRPSALVVALLLAATLVVAPASTYTTAGLDRGAGVDVEDDPNAVVGVEVGSIGDKSGGNLATITNNFDEERRFTIRLDSNRDKYDLVTPNDSGNEVTVMLLPGGSATIEYDRSPGNGNGNGNNGNGNGNGGGPPPSLVFTVTTDERGVAATLTRTR